MLSIGPEYIGFGFFSAKAENFQNINHQSVLGSGHIEGQVWVRSHRQKWYHMIEIADAQVEREVLE